MSIKELYKKFIKSNGVITDSRKIITNCIFFSIKGPNFNGNEFAKTAIENGALFAVVDDKNYFYDNKNYIYVEDCLDTLQKLANFHRNKLKTKIIGITGSNGKTTSKELINSVLKTHFKDYEIEDSILVIDTLDGMGTGFYVRKDYVITNQHVVDESNFVNLRDMIGNRFTGQVIAKDISTDLALIKVSQEGVPLKFEKDCSVKRRENVFTVGHPKGYEYSTSRGIVSSIRNIENPFYKATGVKMYIQIDAPISSGNSGGPLFDMNGNVIGINTAILGRNGSIGIGFSIPSNSAKIVINQLIEFGETKRGWLGVRIQDVTKEIAEVEKLDKPRGALVASVAENSPSAKAGVKAGDIILEFNGEKINQMKELPMIVARTAVGKKVEVKIWRDKKEIVKIVTLGRLETSEDFKVSEKTESPKETEIKDLKITVRQINKEDIKSRNLPNQTSGLVVTKIANDSPLLSSVEVNSVIIEAQKKRIRNANDLNQIVKQVLKSNQKTILLVIYNSQNQRRYIGVKLD